MTINFTASTDKYTVSNAVSSMFAWMCCFQVNVALLRLSDSFWQKASRFFVIKQTRKLIVKHNPSKLLSIYDKLNNGHRKEKKKKARIFRTSTHSANWPACSFFSVFQLYLSFKRIYLSSFCVVLGSLSQSGTLQSQLTAGVRMLSIKYDNGLFYILPNASRHL